MSSTDDAQQAARALLSAVVINNSSSTSLSSASSSSTTTTTFSSSSSSSSVSTVPLTVPSNVPPVVPLPTMVTPVLPLNPLLSMTIANLPSNLTHLSAPGNVNIQIGPNPAFTAGLLGPGGLPSLLASVQPTRVLTFINMLTDNDYFVPKMTVKSSSSSFVSPSSTTYSYVIEDIVNDVIVEAQSILTLANTALQQQYHQQMALLSSASASLPTPTPPPSPPSVGNLIRIVCPLPKLGETIEPKHIVRPTQLNIVGATGLLEDSRSKTTSASSATTDNSLALTIPTTREEFYKKSLAQSGMNLSSTILQNRHASSSHHNPYDNTDHLPVDRYGSGSRSPSRERNHDNHTNDDSTNNTIDLKPEDRTKGLGKIFLEFDTVNAAVLVQKELSGKFFNGHIVLSSFVDEYKFNQGEYASLQPCKRKEENSNPEGEDMDTRDNTPHATVPTPENTGTVGGIEIGSGSIIITGPSKK